MVELVGILPAPPRRSVRACCVCMAAPTITSVTDNVAPVTGTLSNGAYTNDPGPTVQVSLSVTFSEGPASFVVGDTMATGGALVSNLQQINATTYTATFTAAAGINIRRARE